LASARSPRRSSPVRASARRTRRESCSRRATPNAHPISRPAFRASASLATTRKCSTSHPWCCCAFARRTREGATPVFPPTDAARALFDRLGSAIEIPHETAFEATSASTATIAAYFAYLNAICRWLIAQGVSQKAARQQVAATFAGLASQLRDHVSDFAELARDHATAGGTNEQFLGVLERARVFDAVDDGLNRVLDRLAKRSGNL
jgi:pyrroline-5-carboxylate reductase